MKANIKVSGVASVAIKDLEGFPNNPRRGDIEAIAHSLKAHGQYRPIVVQVGTNYILAGNHTYKAAKKLGWKKIKATFVECDEATARRMVLADNRLTDLASYNEPLLKNLLTSLPELEGTGFTQSEVESLDRLITGEEKSSISAKPLPSDPEVKIGMWRFTVEKDAYDAWKEQLYQEAQTKQKANKIIKERLGFPERKPIEPEPSREFTQIDPSDVETVPLTALTVHPLNPREGDIGSIIESLTHLGQYRPIVANRKTTHIVSGNHTYQAAYQMGWEQIAVHWIDVDEVEEIKILIVDNRTSDLASYDPLELNKMLMNGSMAGTGFSREEVAEILSGGKTKPGHAPVGRTSIRVGDHVMRVHTEDLNQWSNAVWGWEDIATMLMLPQEACSTEVE